MINRRLPVLKSGDWVEIVAPASGCSSELLNDIRNTLNNWGLNCLIDENIWGADLLCANNDAMRFSLLKKALENKQTKAILCARGGYGSMRLIPDLIKMNQPSQQKLFIGMSDITALNLFFQQQWQWPILHAGLVLDKFDEESIIAFKKILLGEHKSYQFSLHPLNETAREQKNLSAVITGGNLSLIQASIGTGWQMQTHHKILFIEEVSERGYRVDRILNHLKQAHIFEYTKAVVFGDFRGGLEPDGSSLVPAVLERFAQELYIPVFSLPGFGHGPRNYPLPLGISVTINSARNNYVLTFER